MRVWSLGGLYGSGLQGIKCLKNGLIPPRWACIFLRICIGIRPGPKQNATRTYAAKSTIGCRVDGQLAMGGRTNPVGTYPEAMIIE